MIIDVFFTILLCVLIGGGSLIAALAMISGACTLIRER